MESRDRFDVCVVAAKPDELRHINGVFEQRFGASTPFRKGLLYEVRGIYGDTKTVYLTTCGQQGNVYSGVTVSEVVSQFSPSLLIFAGTAGSLNPAMLRIGDVIVPRGVQCRMYERLVAEGERDYVTFASSQRKLEIFHEKSILIPMLRTAEVGRRSLSLFGRFNIDLFNKAIRSAFEGDAISTISIPAPFDQSIGREVSVVDDIEIFTCDLLINSDAYRQFINGEVHIKACAVDTESYGHLMALNSIPQTNIVPFSLIIRGISDYAGRRSENAKDPRWGSIANRNAALVSAEVISQHLRVQRSTAA